MNNSRQSRNNPMQTETMSMDDWLKMEGRNKSKRLNLREINTLPTLIQYQDMNPLLFTFVRNNNELSYPVQMDRSLRLGVWEGASYTGGWEGAAYTLYKYILDQLKKEGKECEQFSKPVSKHDSKPVSKSNSNLYCGRGFQWKKDPNEQVLMCTFKKPDSIPVIIFQPSWNMDPNNALYIVDDVVKFLKMKNPQQIDLIRAAADEWNPAKPVSSAFSAKPVSSAFSSSYATNTSMFSSLPNSKSKSNPTTTNLGYNPAHMSNNTTFMSARERAMAAARAKAANGSNNNNSTNGGRRKKTRRTRRNRSFRK